MPKGSTDAIRRFRPHTPRRREKRGANLSRPLLSGLGHGGVIEAGATFEFRIAKKLGSAQLELVVAGGSDAGPRPKGGKKFADLLWPDRVIIEMKSRGANLEKHYDQAFDYWSHIVPKRPPYVILCDFDVRLPNGS